MTAALMAWAVSFAFYALLFRPIWVILTEHIGTVYGTWVDRVLEISDHTLKHVGPVMCLWNYFTLYILYYAYLFGGTGAMNPSWMGIFG